MRLLAVDDDPLILDLLPIVFRQANLPQVTLASSGPAALEILSDPDREFDVLLLDVDMPSMTGIELCRKIRKLDRYRDTPILMLTAVTDSVRIEKAFAAGANDYITKPFDIKEIVTRVRVAKRMTEKTDRVPLLSPEPSNPPGEPGVHAFDLAEPVRLRNRDRLILPFSLGNYLSQLSRRRLDSCTVFAARIPQIVTLWEERTTAEYARTLCRTVDAISTVLDHPSLLMSYEGRGTFLCITQGPGAPAWPEIEDRINAALNHQQRGEEHPSPLRFEVVVGNPITPNASRTQRVKKTFDRAIERALQREHTRVAHTFSNA